MVKFFLSRFKKSEWFYPLILVLLWVIAIVIIRPVGEFPINDDWAYSKNVYNLTENGKFVVDTWPAMNLISQTLYGSIFTSVFGFSFTVLRFSIVLLAVLATLVLYRIAGRLSGNNRLLGFLISAYFCFNVLFFPLAFSFMTDVFFMSFMIFAMHQALVYKETGSYFSYAAFILFCIVAVLNRQHGLILPVLIVGAILDREKLSVKSVLMITVPFLLVWLAHDKYRHFLTANGIANGLQHFEHLQEYLKTSNLSMHLLRLASTLLDTGRLLFPVVLLLLILNRKQLRLKDVLFFCGWLILFSGLTYIGWDMYPSCNVANLLSTGPYLLKFENPAQEVASYPLLRIVLLACALIGLSGAAFLLIKWEVKTSISGQSLFFRIGSFTALCVLLLFIVLNKSYFDRYTLLPAFLVTILLIQRHYPISGKMAVTGIFIFGCIYVLNVMRVTDFFNWQKKRWEAINYLHHKGVTAAEMDAGFEYHGWYKPTEDYPNDGRSWWWVKRDDYLITAQTKVEGYSRDTIFRFQNILPYRTKAIFVYKRKTTE